MTGAAQVEYGGMTPRHRPRHDHPVATTHPMHIPTILRRATLGALLLTAAACENSPTGDDETRRGAATFIIDVTGTRFTLRASDPEAVTALRARMASGDRGVVLGRIARGDGGFNSPWSWHIDPATVEVPDMSMELCDGQPGYVEENVDEFVDTVRYYCPWSAQVVSEVR